MTRRGKNRSAQVAIGSQASAFPAIRAVADIHNALRRGAWSRAVANALGDTRGGGVERYGETLQPSMDLWRQAEWAFLRDEIPWSGVAILAAGGAGNFGTLSIAPPAGVVTVIEAIAASAQVDVYVSDALFGTVTAGVAIDSRAWLPTVPFNPQKLQTRFAAQNAAGIPAVAIRVVRLFAGVTSLQNIKPIVLVGGATSGGPISGTPALIIAAVTNNTVIEISAFGYERLAQPGEM